MFMAHNTSKPGSCPPGEVSCPALLWGKCILGQVRMRSREGTWAPESVLGTVSIGPLIWQNISLSGYSMALAPDGPSRPLDL